MAVKTSDIIAREGIYTYPVVVLGKSSTNFLLFALSGEGGFRYIP
jgi:hypothetical protein